MLIEGKVLELKANFCCNILYVLHKLRTFYNKTNEWSFSTLYRSIVDIRREPCVVAPAR